jgi:hypothetical protein
MALAVALVAAAAGAARAEAVDDDPVAKITQLNRDAIAAYQAKKFEDARKLLKQALDVAGESGLDKHPIKARTHVHMGIVIINGFKQRDVGVKQFKKALEIQPDIALTKGLVTPDLQAAFDEAKSGGGSAADEPAGGGSSTPPPSPAATPPASPPAAENPPPSGLVHEAVTEGKQGSPISISVGVQSDLKFDKLVLAYRPDGASEFLGREMKQVSEGTYAAEIPTTATAGGTVAYYIEADDKDGNPVASRGSTDSPLVIALAGGGGARPVAVARKSSDEDEDEDDEGNTKLFVALLVGSGAGWATGTGDTNADTRINPSGIAVAEIGHFAPEVGYWLRPNMMLSLQARLQKITGPTDIYANGRIYHTANFAAAAFAKVTWRFGTGSLRPFFSLAAGGGQIRHVVKFSKFTNCGPNHNETCVDTIAAGPVVVGPGGGLAMNINEHFALLLQVNSQLAFPAFTFNVDGNVGVALMF